MGRFIFMLCLIIAIPMAAIDQVIMKGDWRLFIMFSVAGVYAEIRHRALARLKEQDDV